MIASPRPTCGCLDCPEKIRADGFEILLADALVREERLRFMVQKALDDIIEASDLVEKPLKAE